MLKSAARQRTVFFRYCMNFSFAMNPPAGCLRVQFFAEYAESSRAGFIPNRASEFFGRRAEMPKCVEGSAYGNNATIMFLI